MVSSIRKESSNQESFLKVKKLSKESSKEWNKPSCSVVLMKKKLKSLLTLSKKSTSRLVKLSSSKEMMVKYSMSLIQENKIATKYSKKKKVLSSLKLTNLEMLSEN